MAYGLSAWSTHFALIFPTSFQAGCSQLEKALYKQTGGKCSAAWWAGGMLCVLLAVEKPCSSCYLFSPSLWHFHIFFFFHWLFPSILWFGGGASASPAQQTPLALILFISTLISLSFCQGRKQNLVSCQWKAFQRLQASTANQPCEFCCSECIQLIVVKSKPFFLHQMESLLAWMVHLLCNFIVLQLWAKMLIAMKL